MARCTCGWSVRPGFTGIGGTFQLIHPDSSPCTASTAARTALIAGRSYTFVDTEGFIAVVPTDRQTPEVASTEAALALG